MNSQPTMLHPIGYIGWKITARCNLNCPFCYSEESVPTELRLDAIQIGLENLHSAGITSINFTGGEPTLRQDFLNICESAKNLGFEVMLSSNGTRISDLTVLNDRVDWLAISLDHMVLDQDIRFGHHGSRDARALLRQYDPNAHRFCLKVNTLVTQENFDSLKSIGDFVTTLRGDVRWKLLQVSPRGQAQSCWDSVGFPDEQFAEQVEAIRRMFPYLHISNRAHWGDKPKPYYLLINSEGRITMPLGEEYLHIGSVFDTRLSSILAQTARKYPLLQSTSATYYQQSYGTPNGQA